MNIIVRFLYFVTQQGNVVLTCISLSSSSASHVAHCYRRQAIPVEQGKI